MAKEEYSSHAVGLAFGLVIAAGAATALGAALAFVVKLNNHRILAGALGVSAGVMLYVSFIEIFQKSLTGFLNAGHEAKDAYKYATLSFFGGMLVTWILDHVCHGIMHLAEWWGAKQKGTAPGNCCPNENVQASSGGQAHVIIETDPEEGGIKRQTSSSVKDDKDAPAGGTRSETSSSAKDASDRMNSGSCGDDDMCCPMRSPPVPPTEIERDPAINEVLKADHHSTLAKTGLLAALAIGLHNLPEGLATFLGALADPTAGIAIAVAIALHNIPEGIVVAMPIYYATGSKWKGFLWALLSGASEPLGGLLGYFVLKGNDMSPLVYALLFGLVAGIMVWISLRELIPTALKYDPDDHYTTSGALVGFVVMAASLVLFKV